MIIMTIQHANPYYDDSYAVNSPNLGPYGDAITYELIPYVEKMYRGMGESWARILYGGSTGGWEALGVQIFYPDEYNGAWGFCPDPLDFRRYGVINIYENNNAYFHASTWRFTPAGCQRNHFDDILSTVQEANYFELVLGTKGRSGVGQFDIWQAVFSPIGSDGYPRAIWNKTTGEIDHDVAQYWKDFDLRYYLQLNWNTIGPKLRGKLRIYVGTMDSFYLNDAVELIEEYLETTKDPYYEGLVIYGPGFEHCWSGDFDHDTPIARLTINQRMAPQMVQHLLKTAPKGSDVKSWRY